ncbi:hypothetical protein SpCBS45565_g07320 [Spizellomyces sp. 'palustris']|nr:hypothetical protein SpCBS45565_g07320 [Spizellomyces sp. 'palustris']
MGNICAAGVHTSTDAYERERQMFLSQDVADGVVEPTYVKAEGMTIEKITVSKKKLGKKLWGAAPAAEPYSPPIPTRTASLIPFVLLDLPPVSHTIMKYLPYHEIAKCRQVSKRWCEIATPIMRSHHRILTLIAKNDSSKQWSVKVFPSTRYTLDHGKITIQTYRPTVPPTSTDLEAPDPLSILPGRVGEVRLVPFNLGEARVFDRGYGEDGFAVGLLDKWDADGVFGEWVFGDTFWIEFMTGGARGVQVFGVAVDSHPIYSTSRKAHLESLYKSLSYPSTDLQALAHHPSLLRYLSTPLKTRTAAYRSILGYALGAGSIETGTHALSDALARLDRVMHRVEILMRVEGRQEKIREYVTEGVRIWQGVKGWEAVMRVAGYQGRLEDEERVWSFLWQVVIPGLSGRGARSADEWDVV